MLRNFHYYIILLICLPNTLEAQKTQDTIDIPYWQQMMLDRSNNYYKTKRAYDLYFSNKEKIKGTGWKQFERWAENAQYDILPNGEFLPADHIIKEIQKFKASSTNKESVNGNWTNLGPFSDPVSSTGIPIGTGRICGIAFHPIDSNIMFVGAPQGGFWRTYDKGQNWISSTDNMPTLGVSDICVITSNPNTILIGTGDRDAGDATGLGVYKSTDGGLSFSASNAGMGNVTVNKIVLNGVNNNTLVAATNGGIFISFNQGANWTRKSSNTSDYKDIKYCPGDSNTIYATQGGNFYKSIDGGSTWAISNSGLTATGRNRMAIAITAANPNIVYLLASMSSGSGLESVYKSRNKGQSFIPQTTSTPNIMGWNINGSGSGGQGWYDIAIESSPLDSNIVYTGGVNVWKSIDGGDSLDCVAVWTGFGKPWVHADIHFIGRHPITNDLYIGSDGGVHFSRDEGQSFTTTNNGLSIAQFYNLGVSQITKEKFICGAQDNGTEVGNSTTRWFARLGGDGMQAELSNFDTTHMFGCIQNGELRRSKNNGLSWTDVTPSITDAGPWVTPYHHHPRVQDIMVAVYKNAWLSKNIISAGSPTFQNLTGTISASGTAIRFSNLNDSLVFMGWSDGKVRYTSNLFASTPVIDTTAGLPGSGSINDIETSFENQNVIYVCRGNKVYKSFNKGLSWIDISANLPNISMHCIVRDKNRPEALYVGTRAGVYYRDSFMSSWDLYNSGLPTNSSIRDLEIVYDTICSSQSRIYAATYGRGLWIGDLRIDQTEPIPNFNVVSSACLGQDITLSNTSTATATDVIYQWTITPSVGVQYITGTSASASPVIRFSNQGAYDIKLKATNPLGGFCTKEVKNAITVGNNGNLSFKHLDSLSFCPGDTFLIEITGAKDYTISPTNQITTLTDSVFRFIPNTAQNYEIIGSFNGACPDTITFKSSMKSYPNPTISGNTKFCQGDSSVINFTGIDTVLWVPAINVRYLSGKNYSIRPNVSTIYNMTYKTVGLCDVKATLNTKVLLKPTRIYNKIDSVHICSGDSFMLFENSIPNKSYTSTGIYTQKGNDTIILKPITPASYFISTTDTNYCPFKDSFTVYITPSPNLVLTGNTNLCAGESTTLSANGATSYSWSPSAFLNTTSGPIVNLTPSANITYLITGYNGICADTASISVKIGTSAVKLSVSGKTSACQNTTTILTASGALNYEWFDDSSYNDKFSNQVRVHVTSSRIIRLKGTSFGCSDSLRIPITMIPTPTISLNADKTKVCEGEKIKLSLSGAVTYNIVPDIQTKRIGTNGFEISPFKSGSYKITGSNSGGCYDEKLLDVSYHPLPKFNVSPQFSTILEGDSIILTADGDYNYIWTPDSNIRGSNQSRVIVSKPKEDVIYKIQATSPEGCKSSRIAAVYVLKNYNSGILSANNGNPIHILPNPANERVQIITNEESRIKLFNAEGRLIFNVDSPSRLIEVGLSHYPTGYYTVISTTVQGKTSKAKFLITH